jgi:hypothetical protein
MNSTTPPEKRKAADPAKKSRKVYRRETGADDKQCPLTLRQKPKNSANNNGRPRNDGTASEDPASGKENRPLPKTKPKENYRGPVSDHP